MKLTWKFMVTSGGSIIENVSQHRNDWWLSEEEKVCVPQQHVAMLTDSEEAARHESMLRTYRDTTP
jgi:hypothetical protein